MAASWLGTATAPPASGAAAPSTVARTVGIDVSSLLPADRPAPVVLRGETLRAVAPVTIAPRPVCSTIWSTMVAFAWHQTDGSPARVTLEDTPILEDADAAPDPGTKEWHPDLRVSPLYWVKGARCVRMRLTLPRGAAVSDLRADFMNTSGTAAGPAAGGSTSLLSRVTGFLGGLFGGLFAAPPANAMTDEPAMVSRSQWGAMPPRRNCLGYADSIRMGYVHHTSGTNEYSQARSDDIVRAIQYYHEHTRGYCDIAYSFLVDRFGTIYVGRFRSDDMRVNVIPGSQSGFNTYTFSVSAMGNYQTAQPSTATIDAIEAVLAWRLDVAHLPPLGTATMTSSGGSTAKYRRGQTVKLPLISGHRQTSSTDCPGDHLWTQLDAIRQAVTALGRPKFFRPRQSQSTITPGRDTDEFTAKGTEPMLWQIDITDERGALVRSLFADGATLTADWDGMDRDGAPAPPGTYTATISAQAADGQLARPATLPVAVNPIPISPLRASAAR